MTIVNYEDSDFEELANDLARVNIRLMALEMLLKRLHPSITEQELMREETVIVAKIEADRQRSKD